MHYQIRTPKCFIFSLKITYIQYQKSFASVSETYGFGQFQVNWWTKNIITPAGWHKTSYHAFSQSGWKISINV